MPPCEGIWDTGAFDYEHLTGLDLAISKKDGLTGADSRDGHADAGAHRCQSR